MKKYAIGVIIIYLLDIIYNSYLMMNSGFSFFTMLNIVLFVLAIIKLFQCKHDKLLCAILIISSVLNTILSIYNFGFIVINNQYHTSTPSVEVAAHLFNVLCNLPGIIICYMSYSRIECREIERPILPAILYLVIAGITCGLFTYVDINSASSFTYDTFVNILILTSTVIRIYCIAKYIQKS